MAIFGNKQISISCLSLGLCVILPTYINGAVQDNINSCFKMYVLDQIPKCPYLIITLTGS